MRSHHIWTKEEEDFLRDTIGEYSSSAEATEVFNRKFDTNLSVEAIKTRVWKKLGLKFNNAKYRQYTDAEKEFLAQNAESMTLKELSDGIYRISGRKRHYISIGRYLTQTLGVKHGQLNKLEIGGEMLRESDGYTLIKVSDDPKGGGKNFIMKQRLLYEKFHNVSLPDDYLVIFLNNNKQDFSKENLYAIPRRFIPFMTKNQWWSDNPKLTLTALKWCEHYYATKDILENKENDSERLC